MVLPRPGLPRANRHGHRLAAALRAGCGRIGLLLHMNIKQLGIATSEGFESRVFYAGGKVFNVGDFDIDFDGGPKPAHDPSWQPETTLKFHGKSINAQEVPGMVVPGWLPKSVGPIVLGCQGKVTHLASGLWAWCVVHDTGPLRKTGEGTPELARRLGINDTENGGEDAPVILFECFPGKPATVDGITYDLQPA